MIKLYKISFLVAVFFLCNCTNKEGNQRIDSFQNIKKDLKSTSIITKKPIADIDELEMEVNNGGFNQYFFNSGQNSFQTLRKLKDLQKNQTAKLLEEAITLINPNNLSESELVKKLINREVEELDNPEIILKLNKLDEEFYKYLDGPLQ